MRTGGFGKRKGKAAEQGDVISADRIKLLAFAFIIILIALSSVIILRVSSGRPALTSGESYYNLRIGLLIKDNPFAREDPVQGRYYSPSPFHFFIAGCLLIVPPNILANILPVLLGLLVSILFFRLLLMLGVDDKKALYSTALLAFSPAFIVLFTGLYVLGFSLLLSICALMLFIKEKRSKAGWLEFLASFFCLSVLALTSLPCLAITLITLLILSLSSKKHLGFFFSVSSVLLLMVFLLSRSDYLWPGFFSLGFHPLDFKEVFSVFGATLGFDLFMILIFLMGFIFSWSEKDKRPFHLAVLGLVALSFFNTPFRIFSSLAITLYCVEAMLHLYRRNWELRIIKTGTAILLICALVFSLVNQVNIQVSSEPSKYMQKALMVMRSNAAGSVLSDESNGFMIEFFSERKAFLDDNNRFQSNYGSLKSATVTLFNASRLNEASPLLDNLKIRYVLVTPEMKEQLWESREGNLWLLMSHSDKFDNRHDKGGIDVWLYLSD